MKLMQAIGATPQASEDDLKKVYNNLIQAAAIFMRGGGSLSFSEWCDLMPVEKQAFADAGDAVWSMRAAAIGTASQSPEGAAKVMSPADGGQAANKLELNKAAERVINKLADKSATVA